MNWDGWPLDRILVLFLAFAFLMIFVQVTLFHYRQNFRHWSMWIPVGETALFFLLLLLFAFYNPAWLSFTITVLLVIGIGSGIYGSFIHLKGVGDRVDGYKLRNFLIGPPLMLPGMITAMSLLGLFALHWR